MGNYITYFLYQLNKILFKKIAKSLISLHLFRGCMKIFVNLFIEILVFLEMYQCARTIHMPK